MPGKSDRRDAKCYSETNLEVAHILTPKVRRIIESVEKMSQFTTHDFYDLYDALEDVRRTTRAEESCSAEKQFAAEREERAKEAEELAKRLRGK